MEKDGKKKVQGAARRREAVGSKYAHAVGGWRLEGRRGFSVQGSVFRKEEVRGRRSEVGDQQGQETRQGFRVQGSEEVSVFSVQGRKGRRSENRGQKKFSAS